MSIEAAKAKYHENAERIAKELNEVNKHIDELKEKQRQLTIEAIGNNGAMAALQEAEKDESENKV